MGRIGRVVEAAVVYVGRETVAPVSRWIASHTGGSLIALPLIKTAWIGFLFTVLVAVWVKWRGEKLSDFGLAWPKRWLRTIAWGVGFFLIVVAYAVTLEPQLNAVLTPIFGPNGGAAAFRAIRGDLGLFLFLLPIIWLFAALGEEFLYRGYLMTRLEQVFGAGRAGTAAAILVQAVLFGLGHMYQGWTGVIDVAIYGVFYGVAARVAGRNLLPAIIAHGLLDTLGFTLLYLGMM